MANLIESILEAVSSGEQKDGVAYQITGTYDSIQKIKQITSKGNHLIKYGHQWTVLGISFKINPNAKPNIAVIHFKRGRTRWRRHVNVDVARDRCPHCGKLI